MEVCSLPLLLPVYHKIMQSIALTTMVSHLPWNCQLTSWTPLKRHWCAWVLWPSLTFHWSGQKKCSKSSGQKSGNCMSCSFTTQMNWGVQRLLLRSILCKTLHVTCTTIRLNNVLAADQLIYTEDFEGCQSILRHMTVQNARLCLVSKDFESFCVSTEPWYGGKFLKCDTIKMDWKNKWMAVETGQWEHIAKQENFRLPGKNSFIPKDLVMRHVPKESRPVEMNVGDSWCRAWFKQANLDQPKAAAAFCFYSSELRTPKEVALAHLYCKLLQQELKADAFQLRMAGARVPARRSWGWQRHCIASDWLQGQDAPASEESVRISHLPQSLAELETSERSTGATWGWWSFKLFRKTTPNLLSCLSCYLTGKGRVKKLSYSNSASQLTVVYAAFFRWKLLESFLLLVSSRMQLMQPCSRR